MQIQPVAKANNNGGKLKIAPGRSFLTDIGGSSSPLAFLILEIVLVHFFTSFHFLDQNPQTFTNIFTTSVDELS